GGGYRGHRLNRRRLAVDVHLRAPRRDVVWIVRVHHHLGGWRGRLRLRLRRHGGARRRWRRRLWLVAHGGRGGLRERGYRHERDQGERDDFHECSPGWVCPL